MISWHARLIAVSFLAVLHFLYPLCSSAQVEVSDPLPKFALMQQGSARFSSPDGVLELMLSRDGKTLVSYGNHVIGWDVATGKELWRRSRTHLPACYGNRAITLAADGEHSWELQNGSITEWNLRSGKTTSIPIDFALGNGRIGVGSRCIDVSADGELVFLGSGLGYAVYNRKFELLFDEKQPLPEVVRDRDRLTFGGPYAYGRFSRDGERIALVTSKAPKLVRILASASGETLGTIECSDNAVRIEFSPDSRHLAVTERDTAARLYDTSTFQRMWECVFDVDKRSENYTSALAFAPNGKHLFVCERNQTIFKVDAESGVHLGTIENHSWNPWAIEFCHDGKSFYSSGWGGTIHQWNSDNLEALPLPVGYRGTDAITLSPNGRLCASVDQSGTIHIVDRNSKEEVSTLTLPNAVFEVVEFSQDSRSLCAGGSWKDEVHIVEWDMDAEQVAHHWHWDKGEDPVTGVEDIVYSPDGGRILVSIFRQDAGYLLTRDSEARVELPHQRIYGSSFSVDGTKVFTAGWDKRVRAWDGSTGVLLENRAVESEHADSRMYTVSADPTGRYLAVAGMSENVALYDPETLELIREWDVGSSFVYGVLRFTPDGLWLASGNASGQILLWDPDTGERIHEIKGHDEHVYTIDFGADSRTLCSGGANLGYVWTLRPSDVDFESTAEAIGALVGLDAADSYRAWWFLCEQGDASVQPLMQFCNQVHEFHDLQTILDGLDESQRKRRQRLLERIIHEDGTEHITVSAARRIHSVLSHINSDASREALQLLSDRNDPFGRIVQ